MTEPAEAVEVRALRASDRDAWERLWRGYLAFYRADLVGEDAGHTFQRLCAGEEGLVGVVAVDGADAPVGLAHLVFHASTWSAAGYCYLEDLFVDPAHRGGGAARALIEAAADHARERGVGRVYWHTQQYNAPARSLYDTVGRPTSFIVYERGAG